MTDLKNAQRNPYSGTGDDMNRLIRKSVVVAVAALILVFGVTILIPQSYSAGEEAARFDVNTSIGDNLTALKGKSVIVTLSGGQAITGTVSEVKGNLLHLSKISQRDFYDALIAIDHIAAIETKVR
jgi:hypothetical protein